MGPGTPRTCWTRCRHPTFAARSNLDHSWTWLKENSYCLIKEHYHSLGHRNPWQSLHDPDLAPQLARGEVFALGTACVAGTLQMEFRPLLNGFVTSIVGLDGPSAIFQPRLTWDARPDLQFIPGAPLEASGPGTEYGDIVNLLTGQRHETPATLFRWIKAWF